MIELIELIEQQLNNLAGQPALVVYLLALVAGVLTSIGPCNLATIPAIIGYMAGANCSSRLKALSLASLFGLGTAITFTVLGIIVSLIGGFFGTRHAILYYTLGIACIILGLILLEAIKISSFGLTPTAPKLRGNFGAFILGLTMGLAGSQCGTPVMLAILTVAFAQGKSIYGATLLFIYGIGRAIPIVVVGVFVGVGKSLMKLSRYTKYLEKLAGLVMVALGIYFILYA